MPESAPAVKVGGVRRYGGEVVFAGATRSPEQQARAERFATDEGLAFIPPFDHPDVIAGQGTTGLEILDQLPLVRTVLVPVGGGGLLSGITTAITALRPGVDIIGARQTIDSLTILQEKTKGNLTDREQTLLQNVLFELRMAWIEITNALASAKPGVGPMPDKK